MCPFVLIFRTGIALKKETVFDCKNKDVKLMSKVAIIEILSLILILGSLACKTVIKLSAAL